MGFKLEVPAPLGEVAQTLEADIEEVETEVVSAVAVEEADREKREGEDI